MTIRMIILLIRPIRMIILIILGLSNACPKGTPGPAPLASPQATSGQAWRHRCRQRDALARPCPSNIILEMMINK